METQEQKNDFVFNLLSDRSHWTADIVAGLMEKAHIKPLADETKCRKMACKFIWILNNSLRLNKPGENWIPTQSCVDLTTLGAALTRDEEILSLDEVRLMWAPGNVKARKASRRVKRHFAPCKQCNIRFLQKRANQDFHSQKCRLRWNRANAIPPMIRQSAQTLPEPA